jgi:hypothetical protein
VFTIPTSVLPWLMMFCIASCPNVNLALQQIYGGWWGGFYRCK